MARDLIYAVVGLVLVAGVCTGCRAQAQVAATGGGAAAATRIVMPPQADNWLWESTIAKTFPGKNMTIKNNTLTFTSAGPFELKYFRNLGKYELFTLSSEPATSSHSFDQFCNKGKAKFVGFRLFHFIGKNNGVDIRVYCSDINNVAQEQSPDIQFSYADMRGIKTPN